MGTLGEEREQVLRERLAQLSEGLGECRRLRRETEAKVERLREMLAELIDEAVALGGAVEQEFGVSTDPGYGEESAVVKKARAILNGKESP